MLVVCIGDGLGNQLFQYAFYLQLKKRYPDNIVKVDICNYYGSANEHNGYELERIFGLKLPECSQWESRTLASYNYRNRKKHRIINQIYKLSCIMNGPKETYIVQDDPTVYYHEIYNLGTLRSYMLRGNWINEKYFEDVNEELMNTLCFPEISDPQNLKIMEQIDQTISISLHIRRGDYVGGGMSELNDDYYLNAIDYIKGLVGEKNIKIFIFSDDLEYVKKHFGHLKHAVIVANNKGIDSFRDMQLMSMCKHNIIANSTFSFWGAYLNTNKEKIVIAPKKAADLYKNPFACSDWVLM